MFCFIIAPPHGFQVVVKCHFLNVWLDLIILYLPSEFNICMLHRLGRRISFRAFLAKHPSKNNRVPALRAWTPNNQANIYAIIDYQQVWFPVWPTQKPSICFKYLAGNDIKCTGWGLMKWHPCKFRNDGGKWVRKESSW